MVRAGLLLNCMFALLACAFSWAVMWASLRHLSGCDVDIDYQCGVLAHIPLSEGNAGM